MKRTLRTIWLIWMLVLAGIGLYCFSRLSARGPRMPTPGEVENQVPPAVHMPAFVLVDQSGRKFSRADLLGRPWIVDFIFTRCAGPCPVMTAHMADLRKSLASGGKIGFLSFSVDPENDTPEVLSAYIDQRGLDATGWHFVTGGSGKDAEDIAAALLLGGQASTDGTPATIIHSQVFVLIDADGNVAGRYDSNAEGELAKLQEDARALLANSPTTKPQ